MVFLPSALIIYITCKNTKLSVISRKKLPFLRKKTKTRLKRFASYRLVGSKTRLLWKTPCKLIEDERSLVAAGTSGKCVADELPHPPKSCQSKSSSSRHLQYSAHGPSCEPLRGSCMVFFIKNRFFEPLTSTMFPRTLIIKFR